MEKEILKTIELCPIHKNTQIMGKSINIKCRKCKKVREQLDKIKSEKLGTGSGPELFAEKIKTINLDLLGHRVFALNPNVLHDLEAFYSPRVFSTDPNLGRSVNRLQLGPLVFGDKAQLTKLNRLMWPEIRALMVNFIE